jgi:hypothetical protein
VTATVAEPAAPHDTVWGIAPEPAVPEPVEVLVVALPGPVEERIRRLAGQSQVPLGDVAASWLAAASEGAPVPTGSSAAVRATVPASVAASVRAEAQRRGLEPAQVAAARLASIAGRG